MKQYNERQVTYKELWEEKESPLVVFKIKFKVYGSPLLEERLFQKKENLYRFIDNPVIIDVKFWVCEVIENK